MKKKISIELDEKQPKLIFSDSLYREKGDFAALRPTGKKGDFAALRHTGKRVGLCSASLYNQKM
jgi:hypothetical protein